MSHEALFPDDRTFHDDVPPSVDVVVVGGGIAGTSAAFHLACEGVDVLLLEQDRVGGGATRAAVGVLSPPMRQPFDETVHFRGEETATEIWDFAMRSVRSQGILLEGQGDAARTGLDLSGGYVLAQAHTEYEIMSCHRAMEKAGLPVSWLTAAEVRDLVGGRGFGGGYRIDGGGSISPGPAARAVARAARMAGGSVAEDVRVEDVERTDGHFACRTDRGDVYAEMVVYATHVDSRSFSAFVGDEIVPMRGQGMLTEPGVPVFRGSFATHEKLNVWRSDPEGRLVLGGWRYDAWDRSYHRSRPAVDDRLQADVQRWFEAAFLGDGTLPVARRWSGIFGWTADYLPIVGPLPGRTGELVISGFSGAGLSFAFECGRVIASIVAELDPVAGADLFNPRRFT